jgi:hypothetical protein
MSFGTKQRFDSIKGRFPDTDIQHPLDGFEKIRNDEDIGTQKMKSMFAIQAVPSIFESDFGFGDWFATEVFQLKVH